MIKFLHYRHNLFLLALAVVCAVGEVGAQQSMAGPNPRLVSIDGKRAMRLILTRPAPEYPAVAKVNYIQGKVHVELTVGSQGRVTKMHVMEGNAILAASALKAARQWIFRPLATASGPSGFITIVELKFNLHYHGADLTPRKAERDFQRQVKPPQVVRPPEAGHLGDVVHMRLLVNDQGNVVNMEVPPLGGAQFEAVLEALRGWTFRPAQWGNLPIASYLDLNVPVSAPSPERATANFHSR